MIQPRGSFKAPRAAKLVVIQPFRCILCYLYLSIPIIHLYLTSHSLNAAKKKQIHKMQSYSSTSLFNLPNLSRQLQYLTRQTVDRSSVIFLVILRYSKMSTSTILDEVFLPSGEFWFHCSSVFCYTKSNRLQFIPE